MSDDNGDENDPLTVVLIVVAAVLCCAIFWALVYNALGLYIVQ